MLVPPYWNMLPAAAVGLLHWVFFGCRLGLQGGDLREHEGCRMAACQLPSRGAPGGWGGETSAALAMLRSGWCVGISTVDSPGSDYC